MQNYGYLFDDILSFIHMKYAFHHFFPSGIFHKNKFYRQKQKNILLIFKCNNEDIYFWWSDDHELVLVVYALSALSSCRPWNVTQYLYINTICYFFQKLILKCIMGYMVLSYNKLYMMLHHWLMSYCLQNCQPMVLFRYRNPLRNSSSVSYAPCLIQVQ